MSGRSDVLRHASLLLATTNPGKLREVREVLAPLGITVSSLDQVADPVPVPDEDGATFEDNARIKARAYAKATGLPCLADDSGLEVDALNGAPGVHSARYAAGEGPRREQDLRNNRLLLEKLETVEEARRNARFVCVLCLAEPDGKIVAEARGTFEGRIARVPRGENGFGYDPLFYVPELGRTSAELSPEEKNARSHRGRALRKLLTMLGGPGDPM